MVPHLKQQKQSFGQVYTSGTNEFGDFKVGNFVTIFNRTGAISFVGTVSISELSSIKIVGGAITITGFSDDDNLGGTFASDSLLPTQASVRDYISKQPWTIPEPTILYQRCSFCAGSVDFFR